MADNVNEKTLIKVVKAQSEAQQDLQWQLLLRDLVRSPIVQMVGSVAVAEILEAAGILSSRWAGALEGGVITMVGLQALKDYGVIGAGALGVGIGGGSALGALGVDVPDVLENTKYVLPKPIRILLGIKD